MSEGDDGEEASTGEVGDTLMNQFHIQFRLVPGAGSELRVHSQDKVQRTELLQYLLYIWVRD